MSRNIQSSLKSPSRGGQSSSHPPSGGGVRPPSTNHSNVGLHMGGQWTNAFNHSSGRPFHGQQQRWVPSGKCAFGNCGPVQVNWEIPNAWAYPVYAVDPFITVSSIQPLSPFAIGACYGADGSCVVTDAWQCNALPFKTYHVAGQPCL